MCWAGGKAVATTKISQIQWVYGWPPVRNFYAAAMQMIEGGGVGGGVGVVTWDWLDLVLFVVTIIPKAQLQGSNPTAYQAPAGRKWGYRQASVGEKSQWLWGIWNH